MSKKQIALTALFMLMLVFVTSCNNNSNENGDLQGMKFGKDLTITVSDNEIIDSEYLQKVLDGEVKKDVPYFDLWDAQELKNLIDYMKQNDYMIIPGQYTFNQAWKFENGMFIISKIENGKTVPENQEVFKFKPIEN